MADRTHMLHRVNHMPRRIGVGGHCFQRMSAESSELAVCRLCKLATLGIGLACASMPTLARADSSDPVTQAADPIVGVYFLSFGLSSLLVAAVVIAWRFDIRRRFQRLQACATQTKLALANTSATDAALAEIWGNQPIFADLREVIELANKRARSSYIALTQLQADMDAQVDARTGDLELALNRVEVTARFLRERENLLRSVLDTAADGVIICDRSGLIQNCNRAGAEIVGRTTHAVRGSWIGGLLEPRSSIESSVNDIDLDFRDLTRLPVPGRWRMVGRRGEAEYFPVDVAVSEAIVDEQSLYTWIIRDISELVGVERQRHEAAEQRARAERAAGMAETAAGVLHNVGNVLNSITTSVTILRERAQSPVSKTLRKVTEFMAQHIDDDGNFESSDEKGKSVPGVLTRIADHFDVEARNTDEELLRLVHHVEHIAQVIASHQATARGVRGGVFGEVVLSKLIATVLAMRSSSPGVDWVRVEWDVDGEFRAELDEHKVIQILVNLVKNAIESTAAAEPPNPEIVLRVGLSGDRGHLIFSVTDTGVGIDAAHLAKIFSHGFTTKSEGNGFGLHNSANAAVEMGGALRATSDGTGRGATFRLELPVKRSQSGGKRRRHNESITDENAA